MTTEIRERKHAAALLQVFDAVASNVAQYPGIVGGRLEELISIAPHYDLVKTEYPLVLNKAINEPSELPTLRKMVNLIASIESGVHTQHSASVVAGTLLKERYIDPVVHKAEPSPLATLTYSKWKAMSK